VSFCVCCECVCVCVCGESVHVFTRLYCVHIYTILAQCTVLMRVCGVVCMLCLHVGKFAWLREVGTWSVFMSACGRKVLSSYFTKQD